MDSNINFNNDNNNNNKHHHHHDLPVWLVSFDVDRWGGCVVAADIVIVLAKRCACGWSLAAVCFYTRLVWGNV